MSTIPEDIDTPAVGRRTLPWLGDLRKELHGIFVEEWSPFAGALLLVLLSAAFMASGLFWGVFGGIKLWGDHLNNLIGLGPLLGIKSELESPLMHRISLTDITLVLGAMAAALLSRQFRVSRPPPLEYLWGALGGTTMGIGATLAGGCTTGGFFVPLTFGSPAGWMMWLGLLAGALIGLKLLLWTMEHITWGTQAPARAERPLGYGWYPLFGLAVIIAVLVWAASWWYSGEELLAARGIVIVGGFGIGFVLHRSRFCFSRVFREPFMTGEGSMTKAMILALAVAIPFSSLLLQKQTVDPYVAIPATFVLGSLIGGIVFGIGMIFAGGCASGSLWRIGEGHLKLVVAMVFFAWSGSVTSAVLNRFGLLTPEVDIDFLDGIPEITSMGFQAYLPDLAGWGWTYALSYGVLLLWYLLVRYNESTGRFTVF